MKATFLTALKSGVDSGFFKGRFNFKKTEF